MQWKIATFNVNGIRARVDQVVQWIRENDPDVLCLQEIKCRNEDFPAGVFEDLGYLVHVKGQKAFHGVATLTRNAPAEIIQDFAHWGDREEARFLTLRVDGVWIVNTYVPQGRAVDDPAFQYKLEFLRKLRDWFEDRFENREPILWMGDINVAPTAMDVFDPARFEGGVGCHPAEREALESLKSWGFTDLFRMFYPDKRQFTFWDYRLPKSFERDLGWRLDHIYATAPLLQNCKSCLVDDSPRGKAKPSDHTPVYAEIDLQRVHSLS